MPNTITAQIINQIRPLKTVPNAGKVFVSSLINISRYGVKNNIDR